MLTTMADTTSSRRAKMAACIEQARQVATELGESWLQREVAKMLDAWRLVWLHPPNEGKRSKTAGRRLKGHGLKAGAPDVLVLEQTAQGDTGLAVELKVGRRDTTPAQKAFHRRLRKTGWRVEVCRSTLEVEHLLRHCYPRRNGC